MEDSKPKNQNKGLKVNIRCDDATSCGVYANLAKIAHTQDEFTLDFIFINPDPPYGKLVSRVIISPGHCKRLLLALKDNISKYEDAFGEIKVPNPPGDIGYLQ
jgi:hypothetical protein